MSSFLYLDGKHVGRAGLLFYLGVSLGETDLELGFKSTPSPFLCIMEVAILVVIVYLLTLSTQIIEE
jgi:hypothetical protein